MSNSQGTIGRLWAGLHIAWGARGFWAYRALAYSPLYLMGVAVITLAGTLTQVAGSVAVVTLLVLFVGTVLTATTGMGFEVIKLKSLDAEYAMLLAALGREYETPTGYAQILWVRRQVVEFRETGPQPAWLARRVRMVMRTIHAKVHDVGEAFPAFEQGRAPECARKLLARCCHPMASVLTGRALAARGKNAAYAAKENLLLYSAAWPDAFRLNVTLWLVGHILALGVAGLLGVPLAWLAAAAGSFAATVSFTLVALWSGFAVKRVLADPVLMATALAAFDEMTRGCSVPADIESVLLEADEAFRELGEQTRAESAVE